MSCATDGTALCGSCDAGFTLNGSACEFNTCLYADGAADTAVSCATEGAALCGSCDAGFTLNGNTSEFNTCMYTDGATATECPALPLAQLFVVVATQASP